MIKAFHENGILFFHSVTFCYFSENVFKGSFFCQNVYLRQFFHGTFYDSYR